MPNQINLNLPTKPFNVNEGVNETDPAACRLPSSDQLPLFSEQDYALMFTSAAGKAGGLVALAKDTLPPYTQTFGRISYMPNNSTSQLGVLQWPGLPPETLQKLGREMVGLHVVIQLRLADIMRYSEKSMKPWRPGWKIQLRDHEEQVDATTKREIKEAEEFIENTGSGEIYSDPVERDNLLRTNFAKFLSQILRDTLIYDGVAIWKDIDEDKRIKSFSVLPAKNIRLLARPDRAKMQEIHEGTLNFYGDTSFAGKQPSIDPNNPPFAVAVDETANIVRSFTRDELIWYVRNPRTDAEIGGYGFPEPEMTLILLTGFQNALQFNADLFDKNSVPKGILAIKGNFCYSEDTEVLTKRGWLTFDKVDIAIDEFATLNRSNSMLEWQKAIDEKVWNPYSGKMYKITSRSLDMLITPEHKMLLQSKSVLYNGARSVKAEYNGKKSNLYDVMTADELYNRLTGRIPTSMRGKGVGPNAKYSEYWQIPVTAEWQGKEVESKTFNSKRNYNTITMSGDDYCAFMGMYLAEGCPNGAGAAISQNKNSKGWLPFNELLTKIWGRTPHYNGRIFSVYNSSLRNHLINFGEDATTKYIPDDIMNATPRQLKIFFDYLSLGDGHKREHKGNRTGRLKGIRYQITTSSKRLRDQIQELAIKLGYSAGYSACPAKEQCKFPVHTKPIAVGQDFIYEESYSEYAYYDTHEYYQISMIGAHAHPFLIEPVEYNGYIGCVTVPNHVILTRRNGSTAFSMQTQRQFDALNRIWDNLQRGSRNDWTLPAIQISEKGEIEVINLEPLRKEPIYYANLMNLFAGVLSVIYQIPVHKLGFKISGTARDSRPDSTDLKEHEEDSGLPALLTHFEILINDYFIKNRWPHLEFIFTGKSPKEDARLYEISLLTLTVDERRELVCLPPYLETLPDGAGDIEKFIARTMGMAPVDPALAGIYQSTIAVLAKTGVLNAEFGMPVGGPGAMPGSDGEGSGGPTGLGDLPGARFPSKKDPASSEEHGHTSGVRRHHENHKIKGPKTQPNTPPNLRRRTDSYSTPDTTGYKGAR